MLDGVQDTDFLLQNLMENMTDNIYFKDSDSRFMMVNQALGDWFDLAQEEIVGKTDFDLFAQEHAQQAYKAERHIMETGEPLIDIEEKEIWPDGRITWVSTTKMPMRNSAGEIIGIFGISRDITDHKEAEFRAARYDQQVRDITDRMEQDVHMAVDLQKSFFPRSYPRFPLDGAGESAVEFLHYYRASGIVSGDFCTVRRLSDTEAGIFLCDVMGHGIRAALGTALICAMVEEVSAEEKDPGKYLSRMNELLLPILRQEEMFLYATACYMVFDVASGTLRLANAGHPVPLHVQALEGSVQWLMDDASLRGPALAITEDAHYQTLEKSLHPGDTVVMYTDGLYEAEAPDGEEFGEERLLAAAKEFAGLPLENLFPALLGAVGEFAGEGVLNDDVCLVGFTFHNPI